MKKITFIVVTLSFFLAFSSCSMMDKEAYLEEYSTFISEVKAESHEEVNWEKEDKKYEQFSITYYKQFKDELSLGELIQVKGYSGAYQLLRLSKKGTKYLENDLGKDLNSLKDVLKDMGEKASDAVEGIVPVDVKQDKQKRMGFWIGE